MTSSSPAPKLPLWIFFVTDAALIGAAFFIGSSAPRPWSETTIVAVMACVIVGAFILFVPVISQYERQKNETLDDRQRALEALARTLGSSAEQISIATGSLNEIAELAQKNLRQAEQLPHKLQEKIAEFQAQLANANDSEKEELEKELEELRSSESERIQSLADRIAKTAAELAKLEATSNQHLAAANEAVTKLSFDTAGAIGKAQAAAEQAFSQARQDASRILADSTTQAVKAIESAKAAALNDFTSHFNADLTRLREAGAALTVTVEKLQDAAKSVPAEPRAASTVPSTPVPSEAAADPAPAVTEADAVAAAPATPGDAPAAETNHAESTPHAPKRSRKARREESAPATAEAPSVEAKPAKPAASPIPELAASTPSDASVVASPEIAAPSPAEPAATPAEPTAAAPAEAAPVEKVAVTPPLEKPARKRPARKPDDDQPALGLELDDASHQNGENGESAVVVERVLTSDGATRLIVTAYIGIGNRLFIRGEGPGLSWDKGVPLQFVSIGKWRWETMDASAPVQVKLFKNDEQECSALGTLTVDPGHQHEVTANF